MAWVVWSVNDSLYYCSSFLAYGVNDMMVGIHNIVLAHAVSHLVAGLIHAHHGHLVVVWLIATLLALIMWWRPWSGRVSKSQTAFRTPCISYSLKLKANNRSYNIIHTVEPPLSGPLLSGHLHCLDSPN